MVNAEPVPKSKPKKPAIEASPTIYEPIPHLESPFGDVSHLEGKPVSDVAFIPHRERWIEAFKDVMGPIPEVLPPLREINHTIPLRDMNAHYKYHNPRCPTGLLEELREKTSRYLKSGWWAQVPSQGRPAMPVLCIPKPTGLLRTVVDARQRNANTLLDATPLPDQAIIINALSQFQYRTKIDMTDAYEQVRVVPEDVWKTLFATVLGTYVSYTMQIGDCNAPSTFQRLVTWIMRERIQVDVWVFFDDIFTGARTVKEHDIRLWWIHEVLSREKLFISRKKFDPYSIQMDALGHMIDDRGIHADTDKMSKVRDWRQPENFTEVLRFLGLVEYIARFMPNVSAWTSILSGMCSGSQPFVWRPIHQKAFDEIKRLACKSPILKAVDWKLPLTVWVICDACPAGAGALLAQGEDWRMARPAAFMSKKFSAAQRNYRTYEHECLAVMEALLKWRDELVGRQFRVVTDHEALQYFKAKDHANPRQNRWQQFFDQFSFKITWVEGSKNTVSDALSRWYMGDDRPDEAFEFHELVTADIRLDRDGDDLPRERVAEAERMLRGQPIEVQALYLNFIQFAATRVKDVPQERDDEAQDLRRSLRVKERKKGEIPIQASTHQALETGGRKPAEESTATKTTSLGVEARPNAEEDSMVEWEPTVLGDVVPPTTPLTLRIDSDKEFLEKVIEGYANHVTFSKVYASVEQHAAFHKDANGLLIVNNTAGHSCICVPPVILRGRRLTEFIIEQAHVVVGHLGARVTYDYAMRYYWWPTMRTDVSKFVASCTRCQISKSSKQMPAGLLHSLPIPSRPWESIAMDFVGPFPESNGFNYLWVIVCRLISMVHLVPVRTTIKADELAGKFLENVVRLHGVPDSIVSDRDTKFTSKFWREVQRLLGTKMKLSTSFHPQTDGLSERSIQKVSGMFRAMVLPDQSDWAIRAPMMEVALNMSIGASIKVSPFEAAYGYLPRMTITAPVDTKFKGVQNFVEHAQESMMIAHDALIAARVDQTYHANKDRRPDPIYSEGGLAYLSTKNLNLPKGRARKLLPRWIGPYRIVKADPAVSNYTLELPAELKSRGIHPTFHASVLKPFEPNDEAVFPNRDVTYFYDFGGRDDSEWDVDEIIGHSWEGANKIMFNVRWAAGDTTMESYATCKDLVALDNYLTLRVWKTGGSCPVSLEATGS